jgi:O-acetyl-ADP-ribose deacetylase (regulator of RNase III)
VLAVQHGLTTIAFPAISCGVYGYPIDAAAAIAVHECRAFLAAWPDFERITFALFDASALAVYRALLEAE